MNKKIKIIVWIFFVGLIALASCSLRPPTNLQNSEPENTEDIDSDLIVVGFSQLGSESDWRTANTKSIQNALTRENGFSLIFSNGRQSQENQIKDVRSFIFQEVDYILIAPVTETGWDTVLTEAREAGIPVIIVDRMIDTEDESLYVACVGTDKYAEGEKAGLWLEQYLEEQKEKDHASQEKESLSDEKVTQENEQNTDIINIVVLEGTPNSTAQIGRSKGFEDIADRHENWNILAQGSGDFTKAKGKEVMVKLLQEFDTIDVLVSQNDDMTFGAIEAIQEAGLTCGVNGKITVISFDAVSEAFDRMEDGLINVDIECNPLQGQLIAEIIERIEKGEEVDKVSYVDGKVLEAENAAVERIGRTY
ncbi:MAG: periplasmic binding protein/LacI transcriptional regulator [Herbinix sp.]|jgi:simple sugar transport system substrate-binding protein|nr:periplasmic binding protein/LacI transcriptional regulator [Herbinix sp.]